LREERRRAGEGKEENVEGCRDIEGKGGGVAWKGKIEEKVEDVEILRRRDED
jgi:hypothetical protein